ncbi:MAG: type II secretion system protein F, partial [Lachnospiraceae bacterium]|nr:type II secretion system protein F [Lachnospiraceae bacterium]
MRNFSVPKYWIIRKNWFLDLLQGFMLVLTFSWLFYDSLYAFFPLLPLLWLWHKERALARKQKEEEQFKKMFREWILLLASSLSAGYSVENAMKQSMT